MTVRTYLKLCGFVLAGIFTAHSVSAVTLSDQLIVAKGTTSCNVTITEPTTPTGLETPVACAFSSFTNPSSTTMPSVTTLTGSIKVVALTEPTGSTGSGSEIPITLQNGTKALLSDLVIAIPGSGRLTPTVVALISDSSSSLGTIAAMMPSAWSNITVLPETGSLQNLTSQLGLSSAGVTVQVMSDLDVIPEPASGLLALLGFGALGWYANRRHTA